MPVYPDDLVVKPEDIAKKFGIANPTPDQLDTISDAIVDCQSDVVNYLNRPIFAYQAVLSGIYPVTGYPLEHWRAWPDAQQYDDMITVVSSVAYPNGSFDVTFKVGLDGPNDPRVVRYVKAHTIQSLLNDANSGMGKRQVTSVSAEGQSVSYVDGSVAEGAAGSLPNITTLRALKRLAVHRSVARGPVSVWPLTGVGYNDGR